MCTGEVLRVVEEFTTVFTNGCVQTCTLVERSENGGVYASALMSSIITKPLLAMLQQSFKWLRSPAEKAIEASLGLKYQLYKMEKEKHNLANKYIFWRAKFWRAKLKARRNARKASVTSARRLRELQAEVDKRLQKSLTRSAHASLLPYIYIVTVATLCAAFIATMSLSIGMARSRLWLISAGLSVVFDLLVGTPFYITYTTLCKHWYIYMRMRMNGDAKARKMRARKDMRIYDVLHDSSISRGKVHDVRYDVLHTKRYPPLLRAVYHCDFEEFGALMDEGEDAQVFTADTVHEPANMLPTGYVSGYSLLGYSLMIGGHATEFLLTHYPECREPHYPATQGGTVLHEAIAMGFDHQLTIDLLDLLADHGVLAGSVVGRNRDAQGDTASYMAESLARGIFLNGAYVPLCRGIENARAHETAVTFLGSWADVEDGDQARH